MSRGRRIEWRNQEVLVDPVGVNELRDWTLKLAAGEVDRAEFVSYTNWLMFAYATGGGIESVVS